MKTKVMPRKQKTETAEQKLTIPIHCAHTRIANIEELKPNPANPNKHPEKQIKMLAKIMAYNGWRHPIKVSKLSGNIVSGHGRLQAAKILGLTEVPVDEQEYQDLGEEYSDLLADNKIAELAELDQKLAVDLLSALDGELGLPDIELTGFSLDEASGLLGRTGGTDNQDDVPIEPPAKAVTQPSQVYELTVDGERKHYVICGDCRDFLVINRLFGDKKVNVVMTSPPYAAQREYDKSSGFMPIEASKYVEWFENVAANIKSILAENGSYFLNIKEHTEDGQRSLYVKDLTLAHVRQWDWLFIDEFCWKRSGVPGKWPNRFKNQWEPIFHFSKSKDIKIVHANVAYKSDGGFSYNADNRETSNSGFTRSYNTSLDEALAYPGNVIECGAETGQSDNHTAPFPTALVEFFIKAFSDKNDTVFDPFLGSGTTLIAAERLGRSCYGIEISPIYCDVIVKRFQKVFPEGKVKLIEANQSKEA